MREAVDAGLGEFRRLILVCLVTGFTAVASTQATALFGRHLSEIDDNEFALLILSWIAAVLIAGAAHYFIGSAFVAAMLSVLRIPDWTFAGVRSAWAIAAWITSIPMVLFFMGEPLLPRAWRLADWYDPFTLGLASVWAIYRTFCVAEVSGASLAQALVAAVIAALALHMSAGLLPEHIDTLLASL